MDKGDQVFAIFVAASYCRAKGYTTPDQFCQFLLGFLHGVNYFKKTDVDAFAPDTRNKPAGDKSHQLRACYLAGVRVGKCSPLNPAFNEPTQEGADLRAEHSELATEYGPMPAHPAMVGPNMQPAGGQPSSSLKGSETNPAPKVPLKSSKPQPKLTNTPAQPQSTATSMKRPGGDLDIDDPTELQPRERVIVTASNAKYPSGTKAARLNFLAHKSEKEGALAAATKRHEQAAQYAEQRALRILTNDQPPPAPEMMEDGEPAFVVEAFRNHRRTKGRYGKLQFLVKWLGYGEHINTWEPADWLQSELDPDTYQSLLNTYTAMQRGQDKGSAEDLRPCARPRGMASDSSDFC